MYFEAITHLNARQGGEFVERRRNVGVNFSQRLLANSESAQKIMFGFVEISL
mgnify:CR=1 FL=1